MKIEFEFQLSPPFLFNGLKHHRQIISDFIEHSISDKYSSYDLNVQMKIIGKSMIDLYYGDLKEGEITGEIAGLLKKGNNFDNADYHKYIDAAPKKYRTVQISDGSDWTLILGKDKSRFVHIHPSRGSKYTIRTRALSIKTAIMLKVFFTEELQSGNLVSLVNKVRLHFLHDSPIKNELNTIRIKRVLDLL